jgi:hypothetical protein
MKPAIGTTAFVLITVWFLLQWPKLISFVMFPILLVVYVRLALREERGSVAACGEVWTRYASTLAFLPRWNDGQN